MCKRSDSNCGRSGGPTARTPWGALAIPGIECSAIKGIVSKIPCAEGRDVRATYNDGARLTPIGHTRAICLCDAFLEGYNSVGRRAACNVNIDLNRDGHTV